MRRKTTFISLVIILTIAIWIRLPFITQSIPYFHDEDEGHHFNRLVEMMKNNDLNPHYWHKPSLHFYARLPVVYGWYWTERALGKINSKREIITRDQFGLAGYSFSVSHPSLLKSVRAESVFFQILILGVTFAIAMKLFNSIRVGLLSAALVCVAPGILQYSGTVGVDSLMTLLALVATLLAIDAFENPRPINLIELSLVCGLATSTKYNAAVLFCLPIGIIFAKSIPPLKAIGVSALAMCFGFLIASPYSLISLGEFINQSSYELWHYAVAGHVGHEAGRGFPQALFYTDWLLNDGFGILPVIIGLVGAFVFRRDGRFRIFFLFPATYFLFMILQKANFTRNMIVVIPYLAISAAAVLDGVSRRMKIRPFYFVIFAFLIFAEPFYDSLTLREAVANESDSRTEMLDWLKTHSRTTNLAVSGELQFSRRSLPQGATILSQGNTSPDELLLNGFQTVVVPTGKVSSLTQAKFGNYSELSTFGNSNDLTRVLNNPAMTALSVSIDQTKLKSAIKAEQESLPTFRFKNSGNAKIWEPENITSNPSGEAHIWIQSTVSQIELRGANKDIRPGPVDLHLNIMTPWKGETMTFLLLGGTQTYSFPEGVAGQWISVPLRLSKGDFSEKDLTIGIVISTIDSPLARGVNTDNRRLGVAIKDISIDEQK